MEMTMTKRIKASDLPEFDAAQYLDSEAAVAAYLTDILEANDPALLAAALGDLARARGMSEIAKASGLTREALYKALRPDAKPRYDTIAKVCGALGVRLVAQAVHV
jgi:probable addiction module antidote protein